MKQHKTIFTMATMLLMAGGLLASCSSDELSSVPVPDGTDESKVYMLCIETQKGGGASQRALAEDGEYIRSTWATTDKVYVKKGDSWFYGELQPQSDGASTTLRGVIAGMEIAAGDVLTLQYLKKGDMTYDGQIGTLADISENFDYATAEVTVSSVDSEGNVYLTESSADFKNQQAILKLTLKDEDGNDINAAQLKVTSGEKTFMVTPASATNVMYVAVPGGTDCVRFLASNSNHRYYYGDIPRQYKGYFKTFTLDMKECGVALANSEIGYKVCDNGKAYSPTDPLPDGVSVIGMVACKNGSNGIVLAKSNASGTYTWSNACSYSASAGNFYVSNLSSTTSKNWTCGTAAQYQSALIGSWTTLTPSTSTTYIASTINSRLSSAGCDELGTSYYWSSTQIGSYVAWYFGNGGWYDYSKGNDGYVRPLFAF